MTKNHVLSDVVLKTIYMSFATAAVLFIVMLLLTHVHP
jgi:hypothetical protein